MTRNNASLGRGITILLTVALLVLLPVKYAAAVHGSMVNNAVQNAADTLSSRVRASSCLTADDYGGLLSALGRTGGRYDVELMVSRRSETMNVETPDDSWSDWEAGVIAFAGAPYSEHRLSGAYAAASHVHTEDCYRGHNHSLSGCFVHNCTGSDGSCYERQVTGSETHTGGTQVSQYTTSSVCVYCGAACSVSVALFRCSSCDAYIQMSGFSCHACGKSWGGGSVSHTVNKYSYTRICGYELSGGYYKQGAKELCRETDDTAPICDNVITEITPVLPEQTVYYDESPDTRAYADFLDGHTEIITCTAGDYSRYSFGVPQTVELTYQACFGTAKGETPVKTSITLTLLPRTRICPVCRYEYSLESDGSDKGCPQCRAAMVELYLDKSFISADYGLQSLELSVTARFRDLHTETVSEWTHDFDSSRLGTQLVTVKCTDALGNTVSAVLTVNLKKQYKCSICGAVYDSDFSGGDSGCPYCTNRVISIRAELLKTEYTLGEGIEARIYALYVGGETLLGDEQWSDTFDSSVEGEQLVTFIFGNVTAEAAVTVLNGGLVSCGVCNNRYDAGMYESCPFCRETMCGINAQVQGGPGVAAGEALPLDVYAVYMSGEHVYIRSGYVINGFDPYTAGKQRVTVSYKGFSKILEVVVSEFNDGDKYTTCVKGHTYRLNGDGSDPGCPYCIYEAAPGIKADYRQIMHTREILEILFANGSMELLPGDVFSVIITRRKTSSAGNIAGSMSGVQARHKKYVSGASITHRD